MHPKIGIIGLGYVGLPLACLFAEKYAVCGFDIDQNKIDRLLEGIDPNNLCTPEQLLQKDLHFTNRISELSDCTHLIVTIPTDIDGQNQPDLQPLKNASAMIGSILQTGMTVVFESTVYPGLTEEVCIPILENSSNLIWKKDFHVGYSPERINPGEKSRPLSKILKIVAGDTAETLANLATLYGSVITAGVYQAPSIKIAEAAKVIENAQRDVNIAFVNELALIFDRMGIDTREVLKAASTKWNFLPFEPGLVGGQCIGVDPYYLTHKAEQLGYTPRVIHSGRMVNNEMGKFIAEKLVKTLIQQERNIAKCRVLVMGCAFKENIGDSRNSKVFDIVSALEGYSIQVSIFDPHVAQQNSPADFNILNEWPAELEFDAIVLAVKHDAFHQYDLNSLVNLSTAKALNLFDVKAFYDQAAATTLCKYYWRL